MAEPQFEAHEVFQCIEMEKTTTFILVEGKEVDVYDNALRGFLGVKGHPNLTWTVASGADKKTILNFRERTRAQNFFALLDKDFEVNPTATNNIDYLSRYSIENFVFDEMVIRQTVARLFKVAGSSINLDISELVGHYEESLTKLLWYLERYQLSDMEDKKVRWSEATILKKSCWTVQSDEVEKLIESISNDYPGVANETVAVVADVVKKFPAKMLVRGIYFYLKNVVMPPKFTSVFNNEKVFENALFWNIEHSLDFIDCLKNVIRFIVSRENERQ